MAQELADLVCELFEATLAGRTLDAPLQRACRYLEADSFHFYGKDVASGRPLLNVISPELVSGVSIYWQHFQSVDVRRQLMENMPSGRLYFCSDHFDDRKVSGSEIWQDLLLDLGVRYSFGAVVYENQSSHYSVAFNRAPGRAEPDERLRRDAGVVVSYLKRALASMDGIDALCACAELSETLLQLGRAVWVVDAHGRLLHADSAALDWLRRGALVALRGGQLSFIAPDLPPLSTCLTRLARTVDPVLRLRSITQDVQCPSHQAITVVRRRNAGAPDTFVVVVDDLTDPRLDAQALMQRYGFSPAEARVACAVATGMSAPDMAAMFGVTEPTLRTQLRQLIDKAGVRNLQGLHRLLARTPDHRRP